MANFYSQHLNPFFFPTVTLALNSSKSSLPPLRAEMRTIWHFILKLPPRRPPKYELIHGTRDADAEKPDASEDASANNANTSARFTLFKKEEFGGIIVHVIRGTAGYN